MTEKRKQNPYERIERIASAVEDWLYPGILALLLIFLGIVYPIYQMVNGVVWYEAMMPVWFVAGFVGLAVLIIALYVVISAWWNTKKWEWERKNRG